MGEGEKERGDWILGVCVGGDYEDDYNVYMKRDARNMILYYNIFFVA